MYSSERKSYHPSRKNSTEKGSPKKEKIGILTLSERRSTVETADGEIFYIFGLRTRGYIHGDKVAIEQSRDAKEGKLPEARPTRLIERSRSPLIASIEIVRGKRELRIIPEL